MKRRLPSPLYLYCRQCNEFQISEGKVDIEFACRGALTLGAMEDIIAQIIVVRRYCQYRCNFYMS